MRESNATRREVLRGIAGAAGVAALGPRVVGADPMPERFVVDAATVDRRATARASDVTVVHDLESEIGYLVCRGPESAVAEMGSPAEYVHDLRIERSVPHQREGPTVEAVSSMEDTSGLFDALQWDKASQDVQAVHDVTTGDGACIGVIDDGVLGASSQFKTSHPDLEPNINERLSTSFVPRPQDGGDNFGAGPLADDHGTHVAGTAAAAGGGGVVGVAPDAEIVDIRVFSGPFASFGDIIAAVVYGATVGCDVLNLSLGTAPLLPIPPGEDITADDDPDGDGPIVPVPADGLAPLVAAISAAGTFAVENGTLPVGSAGNDGTDLDRTYEFAFQGTIDGVTFDGSPVSLPNEAEGFMSVAATGPIGYGWPYGGDADAVVPGLPIEGEVDPELPAEEPSSYTNYGPDAVDVSASGGNFDIDAALADAGGWFYDLVFSTAFQIPSDSIPEDTQLGNDYTPSYGWKAGTSFAAPQVAGLAALLAATDPSASPTEIRERIEETATQVEVGLETTDDGTAPTPDGETTAPAVPLSTGRNVALDGTFDGDDASNPDSVDLDRDALDSGQLRGEGHVDMLAAVEGFGSGGSGGPGV